MHSKESKLFYLLLTSQLTGAIGVLYLLQLESDRFSIATQLFLLGALVSWFLPHRIKLWVMVATSLAGLFTLFSVSAALTILAFSLLIMALCASRWPVPGKLAGLFLIGFVLLEWRSFFQNDVAVSAVPVLGAVFMLRVLSYLREVKDHPELAGWKETLSFFLILPNFVMWFFPLIDYRNFLKGADSPRTSQIYQTGMNWILDGIIQLILYRFLQAALYHPFEYVHSYGDYFAFLILNYLNYIRISGTFHIVAGSLCLYGVALPKTHRLYLFSISCADIGRRLNIYWKDFMVWNIYRPGFNLFARFGKIPAFVLSILAVFAISCVLHEYIYLWSTGTFAIRTEDVLFWSGVGFWAGFDIYRERRAKLLNLSPKKNVFFYWWRITFVLFAFSILWAIWNSSSVKDLIATFLLLRWRGFGDLGWVLVFPAIGLLGAAYTVWQHSRIGRAAALPRLPWRIFHNLTVLALVFLLAWPPFAKTLSPESALVLNNMLDPAFQPEFEAATRRHSYYDGLKSSELQETTDEDELPASQRTYFQSVSDYRRRIHKAGVRIPLKNQVFVTNIWGMNDERDFPLEKPPGTIRVALMSASNTMAYGVPNGHQWPKVAEELLRRKGIKNVEILNFSVIGYSSLVMPWHFEQQAARFKPDIVIYGGGARDLWINGFNAATALREGLTIPYSAEVLPLLGLKSADGFLAKHYMQGPPHEVTTALYKWGIKKLAQQARGAGAKLVYVITPMKVIGSKAALSGNRWDEQHMIQIARDQGYNVIDLSRVLDAEPIHEVTLMDDLSNYNHFNSKGHAKVAEEFARQFENYLSE